MVQFSKFWMNLFSFSNSYRNDIAERCEIFYRSKGYWTGFDDFFLFYVILWIIGYCCKKDFLPIYIVYFSEILNWWDWH